MRSLAVATAGLLAILSASACGTGSPSRGASPSRTVSSAAERPLPYGDAPPVTREPMSLGKLAGDPCAEALTPDQVEAAVGARVTGKREDLAPVGPACGWFNRDTGGAVGVSYTLNAHDGLSAVYANTRPQSRVWRVLPDVQGFPAVAHSDDDEQLTFCQASVGVRDDTSIDISLTLGSGKWGAADACELVRTIADMAITTLEGRPG